MVLILCLMALFANSKGKRIADYIKPLTGVRFVSEADAVRKGYLSGLSLLSAVKPLLSYEPL
jgi:hypothetical protein